MDKNVIVRIYTGVFEYNHASQRVLEKCEYVKEAVLPDILKVNEYFEKLKP
jgi:RimJ/RimL family protein N-acetyltransferase